MYEPNELPLDPPLIVCACVLCACVYEKDSRMTNERHIFRVYKYSVECVDCSLCDRLVCVECNVVWYMQEPAATIG